MKKIGLAALLTAAWCAAAFNALAPKGEFVEVRPAAFTVVIPDAATAQESWSAELVARVLGAAAGKALAVMRESDYRPEAGPCVALGATRLWEAAGLTVPDSDDGYVIASSGGNLLLAGSAVRGPVDAALALAEEDLGWRWYSPYRNEVLPAEAETVRVTPRSYAPKLAMRDPYYWESRLNPEWSGANRIVPINAELPAHFGPTHCYVPHQFCHTLTRILSYHNSQDNWFERKPEMFALVDGERRLPPYNPCLTDPDAFELIVADILAAARARPNCVLISVSQGDGAGMFCQCPECRAVIGREGYAGLMLDFVNRVARRVAAEFPRVRISTLAYNETRTPPANIRPDANVVIQLTDETLLGDWSRVAPEIYMWYNWPICYKNLPLPVPGLPAVADKVRTLDANPNVKGVMFLGTYLTPGGSLAPLYAWAMAKVMWNASWDTGALIADFCHGYYGEAAEPMLEYCRRVFDSGYPVDHGCGRWDGISGCATRLRFAPEWLANARRLIEEAKRRAAADPEALREVEREELSLLYAQLDAGIGSAADIDRLEALANRFEVTHFCELEREMTVAKQLAMWRER